MMAPLIANSCTRPLTAEASPATVSQAFDGIVQRMQDTGRCLGISGAWGSADVSLKQRAPRRVFGNQCQCFRQQALAGFGPVPG